MSTATFHVGDVRDVMAGMPDASVDLIVTSPPFLALRSYLPAGHPDKHREIGSEPTPAGFLDTLLALTAEWRRLLTPTGSLCVELGDTYSGSGGGGGDHLPGGLRENQPGFGGSAERQREGNAAHWRQKNAWKKDALAEYTDGRGNPDGMRDTTFSGGNTRTGGGPGWPLAKSLTCIPALYEVALAYGINPLTGAESSAGRWRVRNWLPWTRPNPPVGALGDKFRPATSFVTVACTSDKRWFDLDAVRGDLKVPEAATLEGARYRRTPSGSISGYGPGGRPDQIDKPITSNPAGAPPLDWWDETDDWQPLHRLPTQPYKGSHYATFPTALPRRLIEAMCPREVCTACGEPRRRIPGPWALDAFRSSKRPQTIRAVAMADKAGLTDYHIAAIRACGISDTGKAQATQTGFGRNFPATQHAADQAKKVLGGYYREFLQSTQADRGWTWTDCGHDDYRRGITLDPFAGSGTTLVAASELGRDSVGIDIDERNLELARERCGLFLEEASA